MKLIWTKNTMTRFHTRLYRASSTTNAAHNVGGNGDKQHTQRTEKKETHTHSYENICTGGWQWDRIMIQITKHIRNTYYVCTMKIICRLFKTLARKL